jgi:hypothetical protein
MELDNENIELNIKKPTDYVNRLEELNGGVNILLDEFKKVYIIARMHPNNEDIQERYQNMISNLNQLQSKLFSTSNDVQVNIDDINKKMIELDLFIRKERKINKELKIKLGIVEQKNNSASEMIDDYMEIYNMKYLRNWSLFLSTIICLFTISAIYKKPVV